MKKLIETKQNIVIYQAPSGALELKGDFQAETIWATQAQIADLFDTTPQNITIHSKSIYKDRELQKISTCKDFLQVRKEGNREIERENRSKGNF